MAEEAPESVQPLTDPSAAVQAAAAPIDVFISYASQDTAVANAVVAALERQGIKCWIAPRNVTPGAFYADEIVHAIDTAKAIVLVLSENAADSQHVLREVERAASKRHPVVSLRIDQAPMPAGLEYFLNTSQWLDASVGDIARSMPKLIAAVRVAIQAPLPKAPTPRAPGQSRSARPPKRTAILVASLLGLVIAGFAIWESSQRAAPTSVRTSAIPAPPPAAAAPKIPEKSVAVLPFVDMSEKHDQEYFSDGLSEELIDRLTKFSDLRVPARTSSFYFKGKQTKIAEIAKELGVAHVLEGSVRKAGNKLRVTAQLIRVDNGYHLWSETYDRRLDDVFKVQDEIAAAVVRSLKLSLLSGQGMRAAGTANAETYALLLQAKFHLHHYDPDKAAAYYRQVTQLDPNSAPAWAGLARAQLDQPQCGRVTWQQIRDSARQAAERAVALDPTLADGQIAMGKYYLAAAWDWDAAAPYLERARRLDPADPWALFHLSWLTAIRGQLSETIALYHQALELDPINGGLNRDLAIYYYCGGRFADAEVSVRKAIELDQTGGTSHALLGYVLLAEGKPDAALEAIARETNDEFREETLAYAYAVLGRKAEADRTVARVVDRYGAIHPSNIASLYATRGDGDLAFTWLERAYQQHDEGLIYGPPFVLDPAWIPFHADLRYKAFLRKMKLSG